MGIRHLRSIDNIADVDDRDLIARLDQTGCLAELVARHQARLLRMANAMLRNWADAEEAVQDTFVQAYKAAPTFRGDAKVSTWLHTICYRQVLTRTRRKRHLTVAVDAAASLPGESGDDALQIALRDAVDQLPDINREAFVLVDVLGFSRAEAADVLGVEANTMRARVARARMLLADLLSDSEEVAT